MAPSIMPLNMLKLRRLAESGDIPVQHANPAVQGRVARPDVAHVALEVLHVHGVEADHGRVQPHVRLRDARAEVVRAWARGEVRLGPVEGVEELRDGFFVRGLRAAEGGTLGAGAV